MPLIKNSKGLSVVPCIINNAEVQLQDSSRIWPVKSSLSDEPVHYYQAADNKICNDACEAAWSAFNGGWKRASVNTRRDLLLKVANLFEERADELVSAQMTETCCPDPWGRNNVALSVAYIKEIAACISGIHGKDYIVFERLQDLSL